MNIKKTITAKFDNFEECTLRNALKVLYCCADNIRQVPEKDRDELDELEEFVMDATNNLYDLLLYMRVSDISE